MLIRSGDVTELGLYAMSEVLYHADPCPSPSLNASVLNELLRRSPAHAALLHPRLRPSDAAREAPTRDMCIGSAVHSLALGKGARILEIPYADYKKDAAKEMRDNAFANNLIPLLTADFAIADAMAKPMTKKLAEVFGSDFLSEIVVVWKEGRCWRRCMVDVMSADGLVVGDVKTTASAQPDDFARTVYKMGYDVAAAFYLRGLEIVAPDPKRQWIWIAQEREMPDAITRHTPSPAALEIARQDVDYGVRLWDQCLLTNEWPAYGSDLKFIQPPRWRINQTDLEAAE